MNEVGAHLHGLYVSLCVHACICGTHCDKMKWVAEWWASEWWVLE